MFLSATKENTIRDAQGESTCHSPFGHKPMQCMLSSKKSKKQKKVIWKGPENENENESEGDDDLHVKMHLPDCACGLLPMY